MALMKCPECGGKVSSLAEACPHCGCSVEEILKIQAYKDGKEIIPGVCPWCGNPYRLIGAAINHSLFGKGIVIETTEDRIIIQCGEQRYQLRPKDFEKFAHFERASQHDVFLELFKKEFALEEKEHKKSKFSDASSRHFNYYSDLGFEEYKSLQAMAFDDCGPDSVSESYEYYYGNDDSGY